MHRHESLCVSDPTTSGRVKQVFPKPRLKEEVASIGFLIIFFSAEISKQSEKDPEAQRVPHNDSF